MNEYPNHGGERRGGHLEDNGRVQAKAMTMAVESGYEEVVVCVLGPLEVCRGVFVHRPTGKVRDVLAVLAVRYPHWTDTSALIEALWGGEPTKTAETAVRNYMSHLRDVLSADGVERVEKRWRLNPAVVTLDLDEFNRLRRVAHHALVDEPDVALDALDAARRMVRGEPHGGIDLPIVRDHRTALVEEIQTVEDEWMRAVVAAGRGGAEIAELQALVDADLLRETRTLSLMQALRSEGRRTEALRAYNRLYVHLRDEVAVRPSPELTRLELEILLETDESPATAVVVANHGLDGDRSGSRESAEAWAVAADLLAGPQPLADIFDRVSEGAAAAFEAGFVPQGLKLLEGFGNALHSAERGAASVPIARRVAFFADAAERFAANGAAETGRRFLTWAFDLATAHGLPREAAEILLGAVPNGRSFEADHHIAPMINQCVRALGASPDDPLVVELWSELVCRTVLDEGRTEAIAAIVEHLRQGPPSNARARTESARLRALLHVDIADGTRTISWGEIDAALSAAVAAGSLDHQADAITIRARTALEIGDLVAWRDAVDHAMDFATATRRPIDLWGRETIRATDAFVRGRMSTARELRGEAERIGRAHGCADVDIAVASLWLGECVALHELVETARPAFHLPAIDLFAPMLGRAYAGTFDPADATLAMLVSGVTESAATPGRNLTTLPVLALLTEVCWCSGATDHAAALLKAVHSFDATIVVMGLTPVSTLGPTDRLSGMLRGLLGDTDGAIRDFRSARRVAVGLGSTRWESAVLREHAVVLSRAGDHAGAEAIDAEARSIASRLLR